MSAYRCQYAQNCRGEPNLTDTNDFDILQARAAELARPEDHGDLSAECGEGLVPCLVVALQPHKYAFHLLDVTEVLYLDQLTFVPGFPAFIAGIFPYRGMVLTAIDLRKFLGVPSPGITQLDRVVVLHYEKSFLGILIDRVEGVENLNMDTLQEEVAGIGNDLKGVMHGIAAEKYLLLDAKKLFVEPRLHTMLNG